MGVGAGEVDTGGLVDEVEEGVGLVGGNTEAPHAGKDQVNPGSLILSGEMMLRYLGWAEAADLVIKGMNGAIGQKRVTYDFERLMEDATLLKCSEFGQAMIENM